MPIIDQTMAIPLDLYRDTRLTSGARDVYGLLLSFADPWTFADCYPSIQKVATLGSLQRSVVSKHIRTLVDTGWIIRFPRKTSEGDKDSTLYSFPRQPRRSQTRGRPQKVVYPLPAKSGHNQEPVSKTDPDEHVGPLTLFIRKEISKALAKK